MSQEPPSSVEYLRLGASNPLPKVWAIVIVAKSLYSVTKSLLKCLAPYLLSPLPPMAWSSFRWSTVIWRISAFSNLEEPWSEGEKVLVSIKNFILVLVLKLILTNELVHETHSPPLFWEYKAKLSLWRSVWSSYLFLEGTGYESPELRQTVVDPVPAPLLNYLRNPAASI